MSVATGRRVAVGITTESTVWIELPDVRTVCRHHFKDCPASGPSWASTSRAQSRCLIDPKAVPARLSLGSKSETERSDTLFGGLVEFRTRKIT